MFRNVGKWPPKTLLTSQKNSDHIYTVAEAWSHSMYEFSLPRAWQHHLLRLRIFEQKMITRQSQEIFCASKIFPLV